METQEQQKQQQDEEFQVTKKSKTQPAQDSQNSSADQKQTSGQQTSAAGQSQQEEEKKQGGSQAAQQDDDDEENMYEEQKVKQSADSTSGVVKQVNDSFLLFVNINICYYDFQEKRWNIGDLVDGAEDYPVLQNANVIKNHLAPLGATQLIISGGTSQGTSSDLVYRFNLQLNKEQNVLEAKLLDELTPLPQGVFEHQSVVLHNKGDNAGISTLLIIGGKQTKTQSQASNAVYALKFKNIGQNKATYKAVMQANDEDEQQQSTEEWKKMADMVQPRHSFAVSTFQDRYVYVYGGVVGNFSGKHDPMLANIVIERFDLHENKWDKLPIQGAPVLCAFGHAFDVYNDKLYIVGGSDGKILHNETWSIDFNNQKATNIELDLDISTAMNKVCVRSKRDDPSDVELYSFGGLSTEGTNSFAKLGDKSWNIFEASHLIMNVIDDIELINYPSIYIE